MSTTIAQFVQNVNEWAKETDLTGLTNRDIAALIESRLGPKMTIRSHVEYTEPASRFPLRILVTALNGPVTTELQVNCNPIVLELSGSTSAGFAARLLCVGSERLVRYTHHKICEHPELSSGRFPAKARVYPIHDGTVVTIYWYDGQWSMASANGYDISNLHWTSDTCTFREAFTSLISQRVLNQLNHDWCYTFGFRHEEFHPLINDPMTNRVWFMSRSNCRTMDRINETTIPLAAGVLKGVKPIKTINEFGKSAGVKRMAVLCRDACREAAEKEVFNYGYVIRTPGSAAPIMCESSLMTFVRNAFYNVPLIAKRVDTAAERRNWVLLSAYLGYGSALLDIWKLSEPMRQVLGVVSRNLALVQATITACMADALSAEAMIQGGAATTLSPIDKLALHYYTALKRHVKNESDPTLLIKNWIYGEKNLNILAPLLVEYPTPVAG